MNETERYLFDLNGYLLLRGVLSEEEVDAINAAIDTALPSWDVVTNSRSVIVGMPREHIEEELQGTSAEENRNPAYFYGGLMLDWGEPIRRLVGHQRIMPYLLELMGPTLRLDHAFALLMKPDSRGLPLHGTSTPYNPTEFYHFRNNRFFTGLTTVSVSLTDAPPGAGGFCCIPGSHKSNLPLPQELVNLNEPSDCVVQLPLRRGDMVVFPESLAHGTIPWKGHNERRQLLFKYCPGHMQWMKRWPLVSKVYEWTPDQMEFLRDSWFREDIMYPWLHNIGG